MDYVKKTVAELLNIDTKQKVIEFIQELSAHTEKRIIVSNDKLHALVDKYYKNQRVVYKKDIEANIMKIMSWIDCLEFLQKHFYGKENAYSVKLCFEYNTPDNAWLDIVALDKNRITIFEFKSGSSDDAKTLEEHEEQFDDYCNKMTHANVNTWTKFENGLSARGFLVYTNEKMKSSVVKKPFVIVCDEFEDIARTFNGFMDDLTESEVMNFNPDLDSSTLSAFVNVIQGKLLDNIYIPDKCKDRCAEIIDNESGNNKPKINIIFVNGKPGSGKTGVALSLVSDYMQRSKNGQTSLKIKYATGNGNLYSLFNQVARNEKTKGTTAFVFSRIRDLYKIDDIINNPSDFSTYIPKTKEDIIVIDEAQRMWSSEKVAFDHSTQKVDNKYIYHYFHDRRTVLEHGLSEPVMVLRDIYKSAFDSSSEKTIIFLIGNGQEIYTGEELGEIQIIQAVKTVSTAFQGKIETKVFSSQNYEILDDSIQDTSEKNAVLYLQTEKRNQTFKETGTMIDALFNNSIIPTSEKTSFIVVNSNNDLNARYMAIKKTNAKAKQRLFIDSYDQINMCKYFSKEKMAIKHNQLYEFFMKDLGADMKYFATEFDAQGLEIDYAYFIWGDRIKRIDNKWVIDSKKMGNIYFYYKDIEKFRKENPDLIMKEYDIDTEIKKMIVNAYRVLLTRAQKKTIIYVEDKPTREYLKQVLG